MQIKLSICDQEDQIYTNYKQITVTQIRESLLGKELPPKIGQFPHMNGPDELVQITHIISTHQQDNVGIDISELIKRAYDYYQE